VVYITVATIVVIVQAGQFLGNWLARRALRR
jgi:D-methionine transport system permease protein